MVGHEYFVLFLFWVGGSGERGSGAGGLYV